MKKSEKKIRSEKQHLFFYFIFLERISSNGRVSEISGDKLYGELSSAWFHHILPKSKYPELRYCSENIILLTLDEHTAVENGKEYKEIENRKISLLERYDELVESTKEFEEGFLNDVYKHTLKTNFFKQNQH